MNVNCGVNVKNVDRQTGKLMDKQTSKYVDRQKGEVMNKLTGKYVDRQTGKQLDW